MRKVRNGFLRTTREFGRCTLACNKVNPEVKTECTSTKFSSSTSESELNCEHNRRFGAENKALCHSSPQFDTYTICCEI